MTAYWLRTDCSSSARCKEPGAASSSPGQGKATRRHGVGLEAANHRQCRAQCSRWMATAQCGMNQQRRLYGSQLVLLGQGADSLCGCGEFGRKDRSSATGPWDARPDALATGKEHDRGSQSQEAVWPHVPAETSLSISLPLCFLFMCSQFLVADLSIVRRKYLFIMLWAGFNYIKRTLFQPY